MKSYEFTFDEDGVPWASPEIQKDYEAALGRFLLAFNRLDNLLTKMIGIILRKLNRADLVESCTKASFAQKTLTLDLLKQSTEGHTIASVSIKTMKDVAGHRNIVAHGHFEQNPFSGEYEIVGKSSHQYTPEQLDAQAEKATEVWMSLRNAEAHYEFSPLLEDRED